MSKRTKMYDVFKVTDEMAVVSKKTKDDLVKKIIKKRKVNFEDIFKPANGLRMKKLKLQIAKELINSLGIPKTAVCLYLNERYSFFESILNEMERKDSLIISLLMKEKNELAYKIKCIDNLLDQYKT